MLSRIDLRGRSTEGLLDGLPRPLVAGADDETVRAVREIVAKVRAEGDAALLELSERYDGRVGPLAVGADEIRAALDRVDPEVTSALRAAATRIRRFHEAQLHPPTSYDEDGVSIRSYTRAVRRAGCYVPGGRAAYPSSLLMTVLPAKVAGVHEVVVCVPADRSTGEVADVVLAAAAVAGVDELYAVGGAQAIAAMAYGTETIRPVDVICGPGSSFVAIAKREVAGHVGVASAYAGPSEVVVVADGSVPPAFAAVDVLVQAEHGPDGLAWLVCWDPAVADAVDAEMAAIVEHSPRAADITSTLASSGYAVVVDGPEAAIAVADAIAPEHLQLMCEGAGSLVHLVHNAGAIFCGPWSPASLGDYAAGPSHVLPTHGTARFASALTVDDFLKHHHVVTADRDGFSGLADTVETLAVAEGLDTHAESVRVRRVAP